MTSDTIDQALARAFATLKGMSEDDIRQSPLIDCTLALSVLPSNAELVALRSQLAERLCRQLTPTWIREGDLSAVFFALTALWRYDATHVTGEHLTAAIQRLIACEKAPGGPYYSGNVIKVEANIHIARFVRLTAKPLPGLDTFLSQSIAAGSYAAEVIHPYALYLLAVMYDSSEVAQHIAEHRLQTPAHRAISLAILKNDTPLKQREVLAICSEQKPSGWWHSKRAADGRSEPQLATTALLTGALALQQHSSKPSLSVLQRQHQAVVLAAQQPFETRSEPLRSSIRTAIDKICNSDRNFEITQLPYIFAQALQSPANLTKRQYEILGVASVCLWVAYTIYDDFLDEEGDPKALPAANVAMRTSLECFRAALPGQTNFQQYVANVFTNMDEANAWEVNNCRLTIRASKVTIARLPRYGKCERLAARSFAHALGPMAVLAQHNPCNAAQIRRIEFGFRHYLIARQLSDDLHDWYQDMQAGQASYVVTAILRDMRMAPGTYRISALLPLMQRCFLHATMQRVCELALHHIYLSRQDFAKSQLLQPDNDIFALIDNLESSLRHSLDQHTKAHALMKI